MAALATRLGHDFTNPKLLQQALTHPGVATRPADSYERLEFLGDRVLGLLAAERLLDRFPDESEGAIAPRHTALVRRETAAQAAMALGLDACLALPGGEAQALRENPTVLGNAMEAVLAALYLDGGLAAAGRCYDRYWPAAAGVTPHPPRDAKTGLQEWAQARGLALPVYREASRSGPPHAPAFTVTVSVDGHGQQTGQGGSKRRAEQAAAARMLADLAARAAHARS